MHVLVRGRTSAEQLFCSHRPKRKSINQTEAVIRDVSLSGGAATVLSPACFDANMLISRTVGIDGFQI